MGLGGVDNDTRGWIMCAVSGIACVVGASIICVDLVVRLIPSQRNFRIQESSGFLACSLSLSFGVMLFSALYSMLPSSKKYLAKGGFADPAAGFIMMACFVAGFFGIQVISRFIHQLLPSHVVDCDHTHEDVIEEVHFHVHSRRQSKVSRGRHFSIRRRSSVLPTVKIVSVAEENENGAPSECTPLLTTGTDGNGVAGNGVDQVRAEQPLGGNALTTRDSLHRTSQSVPVTKGGRSRAGTTSRRPSILQVQQRVMSFMKDTKSNCDEGGPCYGYTDPCGQECFKHLSSRTNTLSTRPAGLLRTTTGAFYPRQSIIGQVREDDETDSVGSPRSPTFRPTRVQSRDGTHDHDHHDNHDHHHDEDDHGHNHSHDHDYDYSAAAEDCSQMSKGDEDLEAQHHHHVPTNGFLSIGLQTVIAIGIHKLPEGFVTYATNHANPTLGFNVFMALFTHNIAEGFAMALPLYMALGSRFKAMVWASILGGLSQPAGAGIAALWFRLARRSHVTIDSTAYACLFAVTAGIMTSVALQLFVESLSLHHNRNLTIFFAFLGMTLLGVSNALVSR